MTKKENLNDNVYFQHRHEIKRISDKFSLDAHTATDYWGAREEVYDAKALIEWRDALKEYEVNKGVTLADLFK